MWATIQAEVAARILAAHTYFTAVSPAPSGSGTPASSPAETAAKGLMFVQLYAIYEYAVSNAVRASWMEITSHQMAIRDIRLEMLSAILDDHLKSAAMCGEKRVWETRMTLFRRVDDQNPAEVADDVFPFDGSHFRVKQLQTIWNLFGIPGNPLPRPPLIGLIDNELVEHRNAIAHGRATAESIGRRYSRGDILRKINETQEACLHIVGAIQTHCSDPARIRR
jgi:hypothetical protein